MENIKEGSVEDLRLLKINLIKLVKDHKKHCNRNCRISTYQILRLLRKVPNMKISEKETQIFY